MNLQVDAKWIIYLLTLFSAYADSQTTYLFVLLIREPWWFWCRWSKDHTLRTQVLWLQIKHTPFYWGGNKRLWDHVGIGCRAGIQSQMLLTWSHALQLPSAWPSAFCFSSRKWKWLYLLIGLLLELYKMTHIKCLVLVEAPLQVLKKW